MFTRRATVITAAATTAVLLTGAGAYAYFDRDRRSAPETVTGLRDTVQHLTERTTPATRPHLITRCTTGTHRVRHTSRSGSGAHRTTRTWYTTERHRDCHTIRSGTETYLRVLRPERWCVRLDDVDGDTGRDDVWYRVERSDYYTALAADDHARLEFVPLDQVPAC
ncbi:hypothetical protein [Streptomyces sp. F-1]|uniref:hypothetical protein n=1 Tax=Streptomyces sp. F-1 TaxID=463642 RepID=UPI00085C1673|nr:hypothetical protein [Streptomyces sp. F-1]SFY48616.1 hypothetical protein STEPF1_01841 [Streptomyces sp. F-1]